MTGNLLTASFFDLIIHPFNSIFHVLVILYKHDSGEEPIDIEADDLYALPYKSIKPLVESRQIDLV